jgi:cytosine/uracil/thiamine/allantoin permease
MATLIEQRTIGAIPEAERHGRAWHLLPLWLLDFYVIHRGRYDVGGILSMRGRYELVNWKAFGTYAVAVLAPVPAVATA